MLPVALRAALEAAIAAQAGPFRIEHATPVSGGCIHRSYVLEGCGQRFFAKTNECTQLDNFSAEADGLAALAGTGMRVPAPVCLGEAAGQAYLVLEYLELRSGGAKDYAEMGQRLAALHAVHGSDYGWHRDNFIGATPQRNTPMHSWAGFWLERRLQPQMERVLQKGHVMHATQSLLEGLPRLLAGYTPAPSLLHGDLWSGNAAFTASGESTVFDPAVYYGDRETDLAMTELFGGFPGEFHAAYCEAAPLDEGYALRKRLYNLYHILNHANLFGGAYSAQAERTSESLLAEIRR